MKPWKIEYKEEVIKDFSKVGKSTANKLYKRLDKLIYKINEENIHPKQILKPLVGNLSGLWKYRIGDYRLVFDIEEDKLILLLLHVGHRSSVYKDFN